MENAAGEGGFHGETFVVPAFVLRTQCHTTFFMIVHARQSNRGFCDGRAADGYLTGTGEVQGSCVGVALIVPPSLLI